MKFVVIFSIALATASAFDLRSIKDEEHNVFESAEEAESRIADGKNAKLGQFPYQAGLVLKLGPNQYFLCSGSLIDRQWILTAAHCVIKAEHVTVYLATIDTNKPGITYEVKKTKQNIIPHERYNPKTSANDIALVKIPSVSANAPNVSPIKLPRPYDSFYNRVGNLTGWGQTTNNAPASTLLQWAPMRVVTNAECRRSYPEFTDNHLCAKGDSGTISGCLGDSGGGLVIDSTVIGVFSRTKYNGCGKLVPNTYIRVTHYLKWIRWHSGVTYEE